MGWVMDVVCERSETIVSMSTIVVMVAGESEMFWAATVALLLRMDIYCLISPTCNVYKGTKIAYKQAEGNRPWIIFWIIFYGNKNTKKYSFTSASFFKFRKTSRTQLSLMRLQRPDELHLAFWKPTMPVLQLPLFTSPRFPAPNTGSEQVNA